MHKVKMNNDLPLHIQFADIILNVGYVPEIEIDAVVSFLIEHNDSDEMPKILEFGWITIIKLIKSHYKSLNKYFGLYVRTNDQNHKVEFEKYLNFYIPNDIFIIDLLLDNGADPLTLFEGKPSISELNVFQKQAIVSSLSSSGEDDDGNGNGNIGDAAAGGSQQKLKEAIGVMLTDTPIPKYKSIVPKFGNPDRRSEIEDWSMSLPDKIKRLMGERMLYFPPFPDSIRCILNEDLIRCNAVDAATGGAGGGVPAGSNSVAATGGAGGGGAGAGAGAAPPQDEPIPPPHDEPTPLNFNGGGKRNTRRKKRRNSRKSRHASRKQRSVYRK
jgi:hypothetical protein